MTLIPPERAQQELTQFVQADWYERRIAALQGAPRPLRKLGVEIVPDTKKAAFDFIWGPKREILEDLTRRLDAASPKQRLLFFEALFPALGRFVESGWQRWAQMPYQHSYTRKAFRAPNNPELTSDQRGRWLVSLLDTLRGFEGDIHWIAEWTGHLPPYFATEVLGLLLGAAIDLGGPDGTRVFETLLASANGAHEIGVMGKHVLRALLTASNPDGWQFVEQMLLAAQRQEGLRQSILEMIDESHPLAFHRMVRLIVEHDLLRFSAVTRAMDVWFGMGWDSANQKAIHSAMQRLLSFLDDPDAAAQALVNGKGEECYLALWCAATGDAVGTIPIASALVKDKDVERRFAAVHFLVQTGINFAAVAVVPALEDPDLRVVRRALRLFDDSQGKFVEGTNAFERIERLTKRLPPSEKTLDPIVWPWFAFRIDCRTASSALIQSLGKRPVSRLIPYLDRYMLPTDRAQAARRLAESKKLSNSQKQALLRLVGDNSIEVRRAVFEAIEEIEITPAQATDLEPLLKRKATDLRRGVLSLLTRQTDDAAIASAERLVAATDIAQRTAGLELLRLLKKADRAVARVRKVAKNYRTEHSTLGDEESIHLEDLDQAQAPAVTLDNALGLMEPGQRTKSNPPLSKKVQLDSQAARDLLAALDDEVHRRREIPVTVKNYDGSEEQKLFVEAKWHFGLSRPNTHRIRERLAELPFQDEWLNWGRQRPASMRDEDGLELVRAAGVCIGAFFQNTPPSKGLARLLKGLIRSEPVDPTISIQLNYREIVETALWRLITDDPPPGAGEFFLDAAEMAFASVPPADLAYVPDNKNYWNRGWRGDTPHTRWLVLAARFRTVCPAEWREIDNRRLWNLMRWMDEPGTAVPRQRPEWCDTVAAFRAGHASEADVFDALLGPREARPWSGRSFDELGMATARNPTPALEEIPRLAGLVERCKSRILEIELARGDVPTPASVAAVNLKSLTGIETLFRILRCLGRSDFTRGWIGSDTKRPAVLSHLVRITLPDESDNAEHFANTAAALKVGEKRLIELAVYAPQWASFVERAIQWSGLADAVWWIQAHTKDPQWSVDAEIRKLWDAEVRLRTPLTGEDLIDGAVDVDWFRRINHALGSERWNKVHRCAKYASGGGGHTRAQLFADAMTGAVEKAKLVERIKSKRHQDSVRALGLLPLAKGKQQKKDVLDRYEIMQEFTRTSRQFGSQRQASEKRSVEIGMDNLARTAGYPDPLRLQWAMESESLSDLIEGPVTLAEGDVSVALSITADGTPELSASKKGKPLGSIPSRITKKRGDIAELVKRRTALKRQATRMRLSLEKAMCHGDRFTGGELRELSRHPILWPIFSRLLLINEDAVGYPEESGRLLCDHRGKKSAIGANERLRIAHPVDLLNNGHWNAWQRECFASERVQPFKQVFRELYVLTEAERVDRTISRRYAGHQVNPSQALALLGKRGWVAHPDQGLNQTFHREGLTIWVVFDNYFGTPGEVEGLTVQGVQFSKRGESTPLPLSEIPAALFSEAMRDVDLMVSVAHRGGVDPEATASSIEMRAALLRETCILLDIRNVRLEDHHAFVDGRLRNYSVHLGSGVVHMLPGGHLCIVPVHAQHRGRLFLPFADDDPKTAEVISKVLLLSKDDEIKDPSILEQIRRGR